MLHPLLSTLVHRPDLVVDHLSAYAGLLHAQVDAASRQWLRCSLTWLVAAGAAVLFLGLAGIALMLGLLLSQFHWALVAVPGFFLLVAVLASLRAKSVLPAPVFADIQAQWDSDVQALRSMR